MKLHHWPKISVIAAKRNGFLSRNFVNSYQNAPQLKLCPEESVSKLLDRRWALENPDTKLHLITISMKETPAKGGVFWNVNFSMDANPKLGDAMMDERCKDPSFYVIRDDLLHPFVNGNKARKLDALLPMIEDCSGTDVVTCGGCQSAHAAAVAVSCAERGLRSHLLLRGEEPEILTGFNLISSIYGNVIYVPRSLYARREEMLLRHANVIAGPSGSVVWLTDILDNFIELASGKYCTQTKANRNTEDGMRKVVIVKEGAGDAVALLGIIRLLRYLSQSHILGEKRPYNFMIDAGTGTTAIGFALGALILGLPWKVTAVMLADSYDGYKNQENRLISDFKRYAPADLRNYELKDDLVQWVNRDTPRKFGNVLEGEIKACQQVANQTGVPIDPIYTLAAWELAVQLSQKQPDKEEKVVMLHTGGTLGMFGLAQRYKSYFSTLKDGPPQ
ncbi:D-cysteine desulfhydrase 2, mitochondrial-like isoform X1 [Chenopodium quinoa]|uniref:Tryptophan synthase beta chain-like PALP domain-containing protein n=2 Tax=Chenopodium quinoa TaxID=63459 RepID=A0A803M6Z3_CHEQI|nr:D-cysteine desulfhydrase 2, mitochondrial-like isoform X1 [Chenopodium quinoa]